MSASSWHCRRSREKIIVSRPEGPRSRDRSAATYRMRQRRQKEWKGGARQREQTARSEAGKNPQQRSMPGDGGWERARQMMLGSRARVFSHGVGAAGAVEGDMWPSKQFPPQLPSHSARARRGPKDAGLHKACSGSTASTGGPSRASQALFLLQCTCQDAGWWKQTATQPGA